MSAEIHHSAFDWLGMICDKLTTLATRWGYLLARGYYLRECRVVFNFTTSQSVNHQTKVSDES